MRRSVRRVRVGAVGTVAALAFGLAAPAAAVAAGTSPTPAQTAVPSAASTRSAAPAATPVATTVTETTNVTRRPLPGWAIALIVALAVGGALAAYPATRRR